MKSAVFVCALALLTTMASQLATAAAKNVLIVLDGSNSMWGQIEGEHKIVAAKNELTRLAERLHALDTKTGLLVYGHRRKADCDDIELLIDIEPVDKDRFVKAISGITPKGKTPLASALEAAAQVLKEAEGDKDIILLTDGVETCGRDPSKVVEEFRDKDDFRVHVVGFDVLDQKDSVSLRDLAEKGGGGYYTAASIEELEQALETAAEAVETGVLPELAQRAQENIEILLDRSRSMLDPYESTTRLDLARKSLAKILEQQVADRDNLAYRQFGGACEGQNTELLVNFGFNNGPAIEAYVESAAGTGQRTLIDAMIKAAEDFEAAVPYPDVNKRVVIITGGVDVCLRRKGIEIVHQMLRNRNIRPEYEIIALGVHESDAAVIRDLARAADGEAYFVVDEENLNKVLEWVFEIKPVERRLSWMIESINSTIGSINSAMRHLNNKQVTKASNYAEEAGVKAQDSFTALRDLARRQSTKQYVAVFESAKALRRLQLDLVEATRSLVGYRSGYDSYVNAMNAYNDLIQTYNTQVRESDELLRKIRTKP